MLRFILKKKERRSHGGKTEVFYTINVENLNLEKALTAGGHSEDEYEIHELVGVEVVDSEI